MPKVTKCVIPAAGFWTRFLPATKALPKEMFPIIDKPVMQYLVEEAVWAGCTEIIIVTWRNKRAIEDHFDSNHELETLLEWGHKTDKLEQVKALNTMASISYIRQPYAKWDGDAILRTKPFLWNEPFLVLFWDDLIFNEKSASIQLLEEFAKKNSPIIATKTIKDSEVSSYWILEWESYEKTTIVKNVKEKPKASETNSRKWIIWKYVLTPEIFNYLEDLEKENLEWEIRLADAFSNMIKEKEIYGLDIEWERFDTWSKIWFIQATIKIALEREDLREDTLNFIKSLWLK